MREEAVKKDSAFHVTAAIARKNNCCAREGRECKESSPRPCSAIGPLPVVVEGAQSSGGRGGMVPQRKAGARISPKVRYGRGGRAMQLAAGTQAGEIPLGRFGQGRRPLLAPDCPPLAQPGSGTVNCMGSCSSPPRRFVLITSITLDIARRDYSALDDAKEGSYPLDAQPPNLPLPAAVERWRRSPRGVNRRPARPAS